MIVDDQIIEKNYKYISLMEKNENFLKRFYDLLLVVLWNTGKQFCCFRIVLEPAGMYWLSWKFDKASQHEMITTAKS